MTLATTTQDATTSDKSMIRMNEQVEFFISDKLRGIPLVSGHKKMKQQTSESATIQSEQQQQVKRIQVVDKRDTSGVSFIDNNNANGESAPPIVSLFKAGAPTASTSNRRLKQQVTMAATTRSMRTTTSTTTTRKPQQRTTVAPKRVTMSTTTTSSTTSVRPSLKLVGAKMLRSSDEVRVTTQANNVAPIEPISSHKMSTLKVMSESYDSSPSSSVQTTTTTIKPTATLQQQQQQQQQYQQSLTKTTQTTLTTLPVNQRRQQQTVVQSRGAFINKLNGNERSAGPNWVLFQRTDGSLSAFELLVLASNILILLTIILTVVFNWIKVFRKRRAQRVGGDIEQAAAATQRAGENLHTKAAASGSQVMSEQASFDHRISLISSDVSSQVTAPTTSVSSVTSTVAANKAEKEANAPLAAAAAAGATTIATMAAQQVVGVSQKLASEFTGTASALSSKAMAIVQPTEKMAAQSPKADSVASGRDLKGGITKEDVEQLGAPTRGIARSSSDLSAASVKKESLMMKKTSADNLTTTTTTAETAKGPVEQTNNGTPERVNKLERLFDETAQAAAANEDEKRRASSSSLDSIELPESLVRGTRKGASAPDPANDLPAPSPNLLLTARTDELTTTTTTVAQSRQKMSTTDQTNPRPIVGRADESGSVAIGQQQRPENPMSRAMEESEEVEQKRRLAAQKQQQQTIMSEDQGKRKAKTNIQQQEEAGQQLKAEVKNHQVVVNKLDKRKTNLEIVDLRDESLTEKMRGGELGKGAASKQSGELLASDAANSWISMDEVAVVQTATTATSTAQQQANHTANGVGQQQQQVMSPSELIESRFHVDYKTKRKQRQPLLAGGDQRNNHNKDSIDSKQEEYVFNNIENELEQDNKMKNRKYFVYIVHDGHFTAKKECIARIELPPKRRITLAELRQLIASSQDISLSSLRRNRFKFVTETYRLLNENEDAAVLHQVYPTQGVFLKLNVAEQEGQSYAFKGGRSGRLSSGQLADQQTSSLSQATIASRRRANSTNRPRGQGAGAGALPAIAVDYASTSRGRTRASSVGRRRTTATGDQSTPVTRYTRSKSSVQAGARSSARRQVGAAAGGGGGMQRGTSSTQLSGQQLPTLDLSDEILANSNNNDDDDELIERRRSFTGAPVAEMSEDKVRIKPRWRAWGQ